MQKLAETRYPIHELLKRRWSPRAFQDRDVEPEKLAGLFEAARWAPSCFNDQPWFFLVASRREPERYQRLLDCLIQWNQTWARTAPVLMLSVARLTFQRNGSENRHAFHDVGLAMGNMLTQATSVGLYLHQMAGFDIDKARELLNIPDGFEPVAAVALGYLGDPSQLPEKLEQRERQPRMRKNLQDFVYGGRWGEGWDNLLGPE